MFRIAFVVAAVAAVVVAWEPSFGWPDDPHADKSTKVLVVYASDQYNQIKLLADAIGEGAHSEGAEVKVLEVSSANYKRDVFEWADGVVIGSGVFNGNPAPRVLEFINSFDFMDSLSTKVGSAFATGGAGAAGLEHVLDSINKGLRMFGMVTVGGRSWRTAGGLGVVTSGDTQLDQSGRELDMARDLGSRAAQLASTMKRSSGVAGGIDAPIHGVTRVLDSMTESLSRGKWSNETRVQATCESYCRGWMAAVGCGTCSPEAFSFPGADSMCIHPGPSGTGLLCRMDQVTGKVTGQSCCGEGGPCQLPHPSPSDADEEGDWPGACCNLAQLSHGGGDCSKCAGGSPPSEIFPLLNDTRTVPSNRRWFDYTTNTCKLGVQRAFVV
jgi:NAD(P)H dehydrogenase (quinone)